MRRFPIILAITIASCNSTENDRPKSTGIENNERNSIIISERIDGPANVRDTVNGKLLFTLDDNTVVSATIPRNAWLKIGVFADISKEQMDSLSISKGSKIFVDGKKVGQVMDNVRLAGALSTNQGMKGELIGYTSFSNIKVNTIVEKAFEDISNKRSSRLTKTDFERFLKDFNFTNYDGLLSNLKGYEIDENWIDDPSPLLRFWLLFEGEQLVGAFHSRPLNLIAAKTRKVKRGFFYSAFTDDEKKNTALVSAFDSFIVQVD